MMQTMPMMMITRLKLVLFRLRLMALLKGMTSSLPDVDAFPNGFDTEHSYLRKIDMV